MDDAQLLRYSRPILLDELGPDAQAKFAAAHALIVGVGGLGAPVAQFLTAAGVGKVTLCDPDRVDLTNLQRQILHKTPDVGRPKTESGAETLAELDPSIEVVQIPERLDASNAMRIVEGYDLVVDGTDNFPTRYLLNDACYLLKRPLVSAAIFRFEGQLTLFDAREDASPCYRCLFRRPPAPGSVPSCEQAGVFGALAGVIGTLQAVEAIKLICGLGEGLVGTLLLYDALEARFTRVRVARDDSCPLCGSSPEITELSNDQEQYA